MYTFIFLGKLRLDFVPYFELNYRGSKGNDSPRKVEANLGRKPVVLSVWFIACRRCRNIYKATSMFFVTERL